MPLGLSSVLNGDLWDEENGGRLLGALYARPVAIVDLVRGRLTDEVL